MDLRPDSYKQNQLRLKGNSTNLLEANQLDRYLHQAQHDRKDKDKLKNDLMNKVYEYLANIARLKENTQLPDDDIVIKNCQNAIYGMPVTEMRKLLKRLNDYNWSNSKKIRAFFEYA